MRISDWSSDVCSSDLAGEGVQRVALIGIGAGDADYERAGGALTARYLTSGTTAITVDFGALSGAPTPRAVARFAAGAAQRGWRSDLYRPKLADKAKPTLAPITIASAPAGTDAEGRPRPPTTPGLAAPPEP